MAENEEGFLYKKSVRAQACMLVVKRVPDSVEGWVK